MQPMNNVHTHSLCREVRYRNYANSFARSVVRWLQVRSRLVASKPNFIVHHSSSNVFSNSTWNGLDRSSLSMDQSAQVHTVPPRIGNHKKEEEDTEALIGPEKGTDNFIKVIPTERGQRNRPIVHKHDTVRNLISVRARPYIRTGFCFMVLHYRSTGRSVNGKASIPRTKRAIGLQASNIAAATAIVTDNKAVIMMTIIGVVVSVGQAIERARPSKGIICTDHRGTVPYGQHLIVAGPAAQ